MDKAYKVLLTLFQIQNTLKYAHWSTFSYSQHMVIDKFLDQYVNLFDKFIEGFQGKYGRIKFPQDNKKVVVYNLTYDNVVDYMRCVRKFLSGLIDEGCKYVVGDEEGNDFTIGQVTIMDIIKKDDTDLINIKDEMLGIANQLLYLLTLNEKTSNKKISS